MEKAITRRPPVNRKMLLPPNNPIINVVLPVITALREGKILLPNRSARAPATGKLKLDAKPTTDAIKLNCK